jgi:hypothetical protein
VFHRNRAPGAISGTFYATIAFFSASNAAPPHVQNNQRRLPQNGNYSHTRHGCQPSEVVVLFVGGLEVALRLRKSRSLSLAPRFIEVSERPRCPLELFQQFLLASGKPLKRLQGLVASTGA